MSLLASCTIKDHVVIKALVYIGQLRYLPLLAFLELFITLIKMSLANIRCVINLSQSESRQMISNQTNNIFTLLCEEL